MWLFQISVIHIFWAESLIFALSSNKPTKFQFSEKTQGKASDSNFPAHRWRCKHLYYLDRLGALALSLTADFHLVPKWFSILFAITVRPLKREGEECGSCYCPPTFSAGECAPGLYCDTSIQSQIPDAPGTCRSTGSRASGK